MTLPSGLCRRYVYDKDSNRTQIQESTSGCTGSFSTVSVYTYSTSALDQLATTSGPAASFAYDGDGRMTNHRSNEVCWDGWDRMLRENVGSTNTGCGTGAGTLEYGYDPAGDLRTRKHGAASTKYALDGLFEMDDDNAIAASYVDSPVGDLATVAGAPTGGSVTYLYYSGHGDLAAEAGGSGIATHAYDAWGVPATPLTGDKTVHGYTGRWNEKYDTTSKLILMGARPYDPTLGRFIAVDPVDGGSANGYDYASQDPVNGYDLTGAMNLAEGGGGDADAIWAMVEAAGGPSRYQVPPPYDPETNWTSNPFPSWLVPLSSPFEGRWNLASYHHDVCYGYGTVSESECDRQFQSEMFAACERSGVIGWLTTHLCKGDAEDYYRAVSMFGRIRFDRHGNRFLNYLH